MPLQIVSNISVCPNSGIKSPNTKFPEAAAWETKVPDPTRRVMSPMVCNSRIALKTVILDALYRRTSSASLGSRCPGLYRPEAISP